MINKMNWWYESGQAAEAAQGLVWFVVIVFVGVGVIIWLNDRKNK